LKNIIALSLVLFGVSSFLKTYPNLEPYILPNQTYFLPWMIFLFTLAFFLSKWFLKVIDQPPLMIFILSMVIKMLGGLTILLVYLMKNKGPALEGAFSFVILYLIFEILEIRRFLSILRPDSREKQSE